jgi:hypothetical protein
MERKKRLHRIDLVGLEKAFAKRRHAEIDESMRKRCAAETAGGKTCRLGVMRGGPDLQIHVHQLWTLAEVARGCKKEVTNP